MESALDIYKRVVCEQPLLEDAWFKEELARAQEGDQDAIRQIGGRCLRIVLAWVEDKGPNQDESEILNSVQDANAVLVEAIASFRGCGIAQFLEHIKQNLAHRLV